MPVSDFLPVLDEIAGEYNPNKVMIAVTGGEPLLRKDLEECGEQFNKKGFPWGIVTNGHLLTAKRLKDLQNSGLRSITISLDGLKECHNWMRNDNSSFSKALSAIKLCGEANDLTFDVISCVNTKNFNELPLMKDLLVKSNVKQWRLFTVFPRGRATSTRELSLSNNNFAKLMDFIKSCREEASINASYGCEGFLGDYEGKVRDGYFFCRAGVSIASVLSDGSISACPSMRDDFIQGNIYNDSFLDCWYNEFDVMRDRSWAKKDECENCKEFKWCKGNGLHLREGRERKLMKCHLKQLF